MIVACPARRPKGPDLTPEERFELREAKLAAVAKAGLSHNITDTLVDPARTKRDSWAEYVRVNAVLDALLERFAQQDFLGDEDIAELQAESKLPCPTLPEAELVATIVRWCRPRGIGWLLHQRFLWPMLRPEPFARTMAGGALAAASEDERTLHARFVDALSDETVTPDRASAMLRRGGSKVQRVTAGNLVTLARHSDLVTTPGGPR